MKYVHGAWMMTCALVTTAVSGLAATAVAQEAAVEVLPEVVVEGTAGPKTKGKKRTQATSTRLTDIDETPSMEGRTQAVPGQDGAAPSSSSSGEATQFTSSPDLGGGGIPLTGGGGITGTSTSIITREQIARAPQTSLTDMIAREAGVQSTSLYGGLNSAGTTIDMRGFGASGSSNTLVLIDGRRQNDWDLQGFDFSKIAKDSIERIEITRGNSGAVLYGDGAVGGVINIVTRSGVDMPNEGRLEGSLGSFNTREGNISASGSSGPFSAFVYGNVFGSDGYRENNELAQTSVGGDLRWTVDRGSLYLNVAADDQELRFPGRRLVDPTLSIDELRDDRRGATTPLDYGDKEEVRGTVGFTYLIDPGLELIVDGGIRTKEQQAGFFANFGDRYLDTDLTIVSVTPRAEVTSPFFGMPSRAIVGIDLYYTDYESKRSVARGLAPNHIYNGEQHTFAAYGQQTVSVLPNVDISAGVRVQRSETTARDTYDPLAPGFPGDLEGQPLDENEVNHAWHVGAEYRLSSGLTLFGRAAESFRVPNIDERIEPEAYPTDFSLRTQKSKDWEAGARLVFGSLEIQSSYFDMRLTDEIHYSPFFLINLCCNINLDPTSRRGVETIARWQVMKDLRLSGNLTHTDAEFRDGPFAGNQVPLVSEWTGNIGVSWDIIEKSLTLDTVVRFVGDRRMDNDQFNRQPLIEDFTTVDLRLGGEIDKFFWSAAVNNLFGVDYFDYAVASSDIIGRYSAYPQPGRTFMVKAGTTW